jgi:uncharacterized protein
MTDAFRVLDVRVTIAGQDVTSRFLPLLTDVDVNKTSKRSAHTCEMTLADKDGTILLPKDGDPITVTVQGTTIFEGTVNNVKSSGGRGGRTLKVSGTSSDQKSKVKQPVHRHKDNATFKDVATEWGREAGLTVTIAGDVGDAQRPYWSMQNESFQQWAMRSASEIGATLQIVGNRAVFAPRNDSTSASGKALTSINAAWGDNLLRWDIASADSRPAYKKVRGRYFDRKEGKFKYVDAEVQNTESNADLEVRLPFADEKQAKASLKSQAKSSEREKGGGSVQIVGDARAEPQARCFVSGARPGIDGEYIIDAVKHSIKKSSGFETDLTLKLPTGSAGKDSRGSSGVGGASPSGGGSGNVPLAL